MCECIFTMYYYDDTLSTGADRDPLRHRIFPVIHILMAVHSVRT